MNRITPSDLSELISYDSETGKLFWLPRSASQVKSESPHYADRWNSRFAGREAFTAVCGNGYLQGHIHSGKYLAHRVAWALFFGHWPTQIDHINGCRSDNRIANLREVTQSENNRNLARRDKNKSGAAGVRWSKGAWQAEIGLLGKPKYIGRFQIKEDAIAARKAAEILHGFHPNHGRSAA